jgi:SAM-dependent methyltransferase
MDHRAAVGGMWDVIGALQFDYLVAQGLRPEHYLLDIGCGSLRGGGRFIWYLDVGHYFGIEKEGELLDMGISREILTLRDRQPVFRVCEHFDFVGLSPKPFDFALAQSVFTHLPAAEIELCLRTACSTLRSGSVNRDRCANRATTAAATSIRWTASSRSVARRGRSSISASGATREAR